MSSRRRALLVLVSALVLAAAAWAASVLIGQTRVEFEGTDGGSLAVRTDLPLATCSKEFTGGFPWVRLGCEPRGEAEAAGRAPTAEAGSESLDTTETAE